jgi:hypothetical protein
LFAFAIQAVAESGVEVSDPAGKSLSNDLIRFIGRDFPVSSHAGQRPGSQADDGEVSV